MSILVRNQQFKLEMASLAVMSKDINQANTLLNELYHIHDNVFDMGKKARGDKMNSIIQDIETCMKNCHFDKQLQLAEKESTTTENNEETAAPAPATTPTPTLSKADKVRAYYIYGKALDAREGYNKSSEKFLSKAVKLAPNDVNAWNALANCFWKKGDLQQAVQCFQSALEQNENPHSLRELSILRRQLGGSNDEMVQNMSNSMKEAKKAIALDVTDQKSWYVLGNAHLAQFFQMKHDPTDLSKALKAYQRALGKGKGKGKGEQNESKSGTTTDTTASVLSSTVNPDLYFNRATVHKYLENYDQAIEDFKSARTIDPELPSSNMIAYIERSCLKIFKHISTHCRVKPKKINILADSILVSEQHQVVQRSLKTQKEQQSLQQKENQENEENDGISTTVESTQTLSGRTVTRDVKRKVDMTPVLEVATVNSLKPGRNVGKIVPLKLLMPVVHETQDPPA